MVAQLILVPQEWMYAGVALAALGMAAVVFLVAGGGPTPRRRDDLEERIEAYTRRGAQRLAETGGTTTAASTSLKQQAISVAENVLNNRKELQKSLAGKLETAGLSLKPAEWVLGHAAFTVGLALLLLLLGGGSTPLLFLGLLLGAAAPWGYLATKQRRRLAAFKAQLADTLQLISGSLSAGLSLAQSIDAVVREGAEPVAGEFRRALVESRLGVGIEDALTGVGQRMQSVDFEWVVMAIRIQREVGGNLAELLDKVAETIREREYLQRQVKTLSAEGRLSVWILAGLPPAFMAYLVVASPDYVQPMFTTPLGWLMLGAMAVMITVGVFWMTKLAKVEV